MDEPTLYLVDGHSLTFKAYYAIRGLTSPDGRPMGAVYGFLRMVLKLIDERSPQWLAIVFDTGKPTFRKEIYPLYKANREAPPPDFGDQMVVIYQLLAAMGIAVFDKDGFEADDLIATIAQRMKSRPDGGERVVVVSADKDLFQLVDERVSILRPAGGEDKIHDPAAVKSRMGVRPDQIADYLALVGDASDNIPGVPGIGPKTATTLLTEYQTLEALIDRSEELPRPRQREALREHAERARMARHLATVARDVPLDWQLESCQLPETLWTEPTVALMAELGFQSILNEKGLKSPEPIASATVPAPAQIETQYMAIGEVEALSRWVEKALGAPWLAIDTETTSINAMTAELVGISISFQPGRAIYIPIGHRSEMAGQDQLPLAEAQRILAPLLEGRGPRLIAHHAKYDWKILRRAGFTPVAPAFDTMIASYLLDPGKVTGHGLKALGREICGIEMAPIKDLIGSGAKAITMAEISVADATNYACLDADATLRLAEVLGPRLDQHPRLRAMMDKIEMPLIEVLTTMELGGFKVDVECLAKLGEQLGRQSKRLAEQIWQEAGHPFNIASPKQVAHLLYEELGLPTGKKGKTGYSTNEFELERLAPMSPIARLILDFRGMEKLRSTYIEALPRLIDPRTRRIHTSFNQTIAATGRLSSTDPNLQNIPIRTEMGREIRRSFVADGSDHRLLKADYSQIELRILAHVSQDQALCSAYHEGRDLHRQTAGEIFGVDPQAVTDSMRSQAKVINFGVIYGMSAHGLARQLGLGRAQASGFIERYFATYSGVRKWMDALLEKARLDGWVETVSGRRRLLPELGARNKQIRANAERIAINTPIQGTCADMIKMAMIRIDQELPTVAPEARMVCQVHDELVFTTPTNRLEEVSERVRRAMLEALELNVPIEVHLSDGPNWAEC